MALRIGVAINNDLGRELEHKIKRHIVAGMSTFPPGHGTLSGIQTKCYTNRFLKMSLTELPDGYYEAAAKLAEKAIQLWIASGEPLEGERWDLLCSLAGVDPFEFAQMAQYMLDRGTTPLLPCGHSASPDNVYHPHGVQTRIACRACAKDSGVRTRHQKGVEGSVVGS